MKSSGRLCEFWAISDVFERQNMQKRQKSDINGKEIDKLDNNGSKRSK